MKKGVLLLSIITSTGIFSQSIAAESNKAGPNVQWSDEELARDVARAKGRSK